MSHPEIIGSVNTLIASGSETTATVLSGTTYLLPTHEEIFAKLAEEVQTRLNHEDEIDLLTVQRLDYMNAVIRESMRVYPPVPTALPRMSPPEGYTLRDGRYIPPNMSPHCRSHTGGSILTTPSLPSGCGTIQCTTMPPTSNIPNHSFPKDSLMILGSPTTRRKASSHFLPVRAIASARS